MRALLFDPNIVALRVPELEQLRKSNSDGRFSLTRRLAASPGKRNVQRTDTGDRNWDDDRLLKHFVVPDPLDIQLGFWARHLILRQLRPRLGKAAPS